MKNMINWFEIPVVDLPRATAFYGAVLAQPLKVEDFQGTAMTVMKLDGLDGLAGALVQAKDRQPSTDGALVYLNVDGQLEQVLGRVAKAGGQLVGPVVDLGPQGRYAVLADSEGNRVGVHSAV